MCNAKSLFCLSAKNIQLLKAQRVRAVRPWRASLHPQRASDSYEQYCIVSQSLNYQRLFKL